MTQVFISYKSEYRAQALKVRDHLNTWGYTTWMDVDNIPTGAYFRHEIQKGLSESEIVIGVMTPEAFASREVMWEWDYALYESRLVLLRYFAGQDETIPYHIRGTQYIDFSANEAHAFNELQRILAAPPTPATPPPPKTEKSETTPTKLQQTNREVMLQKVHDYWIVGVLEKAEHNPLIDLTLAAPEKVLRHPDYGDYDLPADADILTIYDDLQREMLILGAPGAGKTTLMLQLARELLKEAQADDKKPIPVVFNLSSWAAKREPLADWLKDRLRQEYQVPKKVAARWVDDGAILPLLDGLDEVAEDYRNQCVEAINTFRKSHPFVDLVVCSRIAEYEQLNRLQLASIQLQPLTPEQIDVYVQGDKLDGLCELIASDSIVREMAETPFLLNTLAYSYRGMSANALSGPDTLEKRRDHMFNEYTEKRFAETTSNYTQRDTRHYLSFLAKQLIQHDLIVFYIENLQPTWLRNLYRWLMLLFIVLSVILSIDQLGGMEIGLAIMLAYFLVREMKNRIGLAEIFTWRLSRREQFIGLLVLLVIVLLTGLAGWRVGRFAVGLVAGMILVLPFGLMLGLESNERVAVRTRPNQGVFVSVLNALRVGLALGLI